MDQRALAGRLLSPAGFGLVLLLFLLPFVTVSCQGGGGTAQASFTGLDMVVGGAPDFSGSGITAEDAELVKELFADQYDVEPLAILAALALLAGMAGALIRERLAKHALGVGLAVLAGALLVGGVIRAIDRLEAVRSVDDATAGTAIPPGTAEPRYGFWLAMVVLTVLAVFHGIDLVRAWRLPPAATEPASPS